MFSREENRKGGEEEEKDSLHTVTAKNKFESFKTR